MHILVKVIIMIGILVCGIGYKVYLNVFDRKIRTFEQEVSTLVQKGFITKDYYEKLPIKKLEITSKDNLKLCGYLIENPNETKGYIILCHGISCNHATMLLHVEFFKELGFSILLIDQRGYGKSEKAVSSYGIYEKEDISLWIKYLRETVARDKAIGVMGHSMGASAALMTCSISYKPTFVIAEAPYSNLKELIKFNLKPKKLPYFIFGNIANLICFIKHGFRFEEADVVKCITGTEIPILLIHGNKDDLIPCEMSKIMSKIIKNGHIYIVNNCNHFIYHNMDNNMDEYKSTIKNFLKKVYYNLR